MKTKSELIDWSEKIEDRIDSLEVELGAARAALSLIDKQIEEMPDE